MTPKEKAKDLLSKMDVIHYMKLGGKNKDSKGLPVSMYNDQIKQCALIAVDEIMKLDVVWYQGSRTYEFYEEVKQEIEKL